VGWFDGFRSDRLAAGGVHLHVRQGGREGAPPLLLLHGYPETGAMWHRVAQRLAPHYRLVIPDLRGYGASDKPDSNPEVDPEHAAYSKRTMAADLAALMHALGHERWFVAGHDRGGRVAHRLALDHAAAVRKLALLDIAPTLDMYAATDMRFARAYYHWFFFIQPAPHPERLIGADPGTYLRGKLGGWGSTLGAYEAEALAEYEAAFVRPETIHAMCEDYRASAGIDLEHDRASRARGEKIACELLVLWGARGVVHALFDPLALWRAQCSARVQGEALPCGHFIPEELPGETAARLHEFFAAKEA
jgi:haloacetate dehalogenase